MLIAFLLLVYLSALIVRSVFKKDKNVGDELAKLNTLKKDGLISEKEFDSLRKKLLK